MYHWIDRRWLVQVVRNSNGNFAFTGCCHSSSSPWSYLTATQKCTSFGHHLGIEPKDAIFEVLPLDLQWCGRGVACCEPIQVDVAPS